MRRAPKLVSKPAVLPVDLSAVKAYLGIVDAEQDARLQLMLESATSRLDGYPGRLGRTLIDQTWSQDFEPCVKMRLAFPNVHSATCEWFATGATGIPAAVVLDEDVISPFVQTVGTYAFGAGILRVTFITGYGPQPEDVPAPIREAIMIDVAHRLRSQSEDGQIRSFQVEGAFTEAYNSPEQAAIGVDRQIAELLRGFRRGNLR